LRKKFCTKNFAKKFAKKVRNFRQKMAKKWPFLAKKWPKKGPFLAIFGGSNFLLKIDPSDPDKRSIFHWKWPKFPQVPKLTGICTTTWGQKT
jgi:hypothetical protein